MASNPNASSGNNDKASINITIDRPTTVIDWPTIIGMLVAFSLIGAALVFGGSMWSFFNLPAAFIVIGGTIAVTAIAYRKEELAKAWNILKASFLYQVRSPSSVAIRLMDLSVLAKQRGVLSIAQNETELRKDPYIANAMQYVADGFKTEEIAMILNHDIDALIERHKTGAAIIRRASEIAPAMGLIGTLVGLVQMLTQLNDPSSIGPAMAVALLTTFYGALLGTVFLGPIASKLERNAAMDVMIKDLIVSAAISISQSESPRKLETLLNAALPPDQKIKYFR
jgi:chemotaxis protein MotA